MPGVRGFVYEGEEALAVYFAEPSGMINYPMLRLRLVVGRWTSEAVISDRISTAFSCRPGPTLEPIDPYLPTFPKMSSLGVPLMAEQALKHPQAAKFRALAEVVIAQDLRLGEMRARGRHGASQIYHDARLAPLSADLGELPCFAISVSRCKTRDGHLSTDA